MEKEIPIIWLWSKFLHNNNSERVCKGTWIYGYKRRSSIRRLAGWFIDKENNLGLVCPILDYGVYLIALLRHPNIVWHLLLKYSVALPPR